MELNFIRKPRFADAFYPKELDHLKQMIEEFLKNASISKSKEMPRALIVPHAGYTYSGPVAAYGYKLIRYRPYKKIILIGPSHNFQFIGISSYPKGFWQTPLGKVETISKDEFKPLKNNDEFIESWEIHEPEHCLEVQLPFLQTVSKDFKILPLLTGEINVKSIAKSINRIIDDDTLIIISSDLSHYHTFSEAQKLDKVTIDAILSKDRVRFSDFGDACGKTPIEILIELANLNNWQSKLLISMNSGNTSGDKSQVVGYASMYFY